MSDSIGPFDECDSVGGKQFIETQIEKLIRMPQTIRVAVTQWDSTGVFLQMSASWNWPGSRWWRVDLHTHSPASHDFEPQADRLARDWRRWIEAVRDAGVQAVAVTDHNTSAGIGPLQEAAKEVEGRPVIFPGVELTASAGQHLLFVFDPGCNDQHINDLLSRAGISPDKRGMTSARSNLSVELLLSLKCERALVIAAHVNGRDGLLELDGEQRLEVLRHECLLAVEVDPNLNLDSGWLDGSKQQVPRTFPQLHGSDSHKFADMGRRTSWVKMSTANEEGLRLALLDGPGSARPALGHSDPNVHADNVIESICVTKSKYMGRDKPLLVAFNPWLNAVIGSRGTGKSTLVDLCRAALRREQELGQSGEDPLRAAYDRRMRVYSGRADPGLLTPDTLVEVTYRKDGERFVLSWDPSSHAAAIARLDGELRVPEQGDVRERFPVRIYSQKQLFELATEPNSLLTVIDDHRDVGGEELKRPRAEAEAKYLAQRAQARALRAQAAELPARLASLADVRRKLEVLQRGGHAQTLNDYRLRRRQDGTWASIEQAAIASVEALSRAAEGLAVADLDLGEGAVAIGATDALARAHAKARAVVNDLRKTVLQAATQAQAAIQQVRAGIDLAAWRVAVSESESAYQQVTAQLAQAGIANPDEYRNLLQRAATLDQDIALLGRHSLEADACERQAADALRELRRLRRELTERRQALVEKTSSEMIRLEILGNADRTGLKGFLQAELGFPRFDDDYAALLGHLPGKGQPWTFEQLDALTTELRGVAGNPEKHWAAKDKRFEAALRKLSPERLDRLALYLPDDAVEARFRKPTDSKSSSWRDLTQGSPGEQTAALLAFVLGYGNEPIILDQPEDDLDNTLIYELVVNKLRETKACRQIIVVTHSANIVVHGDAELVVSLQITKGGVTAIAEQGGLQEQKVRDEICRVMEGGREAFERRFRRIMQPGTARHG